MTRHDAYLALPWRDDTGTVGSNQSNTQLITTHFCIQHIQRWNTFRNADNQFDARVSGLKY